MAETVETITSDHQTATSQTTPSTAPGDAVFEIEGAAFFYGSFRAVDADRMTIGAHQVTAFIGPSGCGKTTVLRSLNRMTDLVPGARVEGRVDFLGQPLYGGGTDAIEVRARIGMVFQRPNPFPQSIFDNVAYGPRLTGQKRGLDDVVETALRKAALWDEVKDKLAKSGWSLSGGQQQRLCIARAIAMEPEVVLMDEPCSALDPGSTFRIEQLITELRATYTVVIVTHNMQQAARVADRTAFFTAEADKDTGARHGLLVEVGDTTKVFSSPTDNRTEDYITGRFG